MKINKNILLGIVIFLAMFLVIKDKFEGFHHHSMLSSTHWASHPQVQHTFPELGLQYPDHDDYFKNSFSESVFENSELCRYHKHRFDPSQL